jgi:hypothetical protein
VLPSYRLSAWVYRALPDFLLKPLKAVYAIYYSWFLRRNLRRQEQILAMLFPERPARISAGSFKGMSYVGSSVGSLLLPKLVGFYEAELSDVIETVVQHGYDRILNVGCAEGYYAVGLAMRSPKTRVFAFDIDDNAARLCQELAQRNNVDGRVIFSGPCDPARLNEMIQGETVIVCDCEGYEMELLDPAQAPNLAHADLLVELHRVSDPKTSVKDVLMKRLESTHRCRFIPLGNYDPAQYPILQKLSPSDRNAAVAELRTGVQGWCWWERKR